MVAGRTFCSPPAPADLQSQLFPAVPSGIWGIPPAFSLPLPQCFSIKDVTTYIRDHAGARLYDQRHRLACARRARDRDRRAHGRRLARDRGRARPDHGRGAAGAWQSIRAAVIKVPLLETHDVGRAEPAIAAVPQDPPTACTPPAVGLAAARKLHPRDHPDVDLHSCPFPCSPDPQRLSLPNPEREGRYRVSITESYTERDRVVTFGNSTW
jgi:hypothetical protein